ncbi:Eco57I restriction-modification methylase domain-containing protein [Schleiferilactobacillus perolens]|uniref:Type II restriction-modification system restriction subunit n=1 Tax=Schleiferilactobacillus perolens DSM 12744 TaxID=1423792 RepID=A0A0R1NCV3_9LACO|nr:Eco57I restriction-modification methylase domain-containing protein [Schleiferilactobacillus perolens]KRL14619.1 type II restriction-modification system restriction subunit [Schleiferilactobacillus perolens DSM 12744]
MSKNFDYLKLNEDSSQFFPTAIASERQYAAGEYDSAMTNIRKIAENIAAYVLDQNFLTVKGAYFDNLRIISSNRLVPRNILDLFHEIRRNGNAATHSLNQYSQKEALKTLRQLTDLLYWFSEKYCNFHGFKPVFQEPQLEVNYTTSERRLIYVQTADNTSGKWPAFVGREKVGEATATADLEKDWRKNSQDLRDVAMKRIRSYMGTSGVPTKVQWVELAYREKDNSWFTDHDVHRVLDRSGVKRDTELKENGGHEWFVTNVDTVKSAISAVKEGREYINAKFSTQPQKIVLRPEQQEAVKKTKIVFKTPRKMLWNAKMRFGKTLSALELIKEEQYERVLIMTHRPVVKDSWFADFKKINMDSLGYVYGSKAKGASLEYLAQSGKPYIYFASIQDLRGSAAFGGQVGVKNQLVKDIDWSLVIIDEAHEGTQTEIAQRVIDGVTKQNTRVLELSGTPFNILDQYAPDQVYTWDYVMEQSAKRDWNSKAHPGQNNPYLSLPKVSMYTFEMKNNFSDDRFLDVDDRSFNFHEFFKVDKKTGHFIYENKVIQFLNNITSPSSKNNYPFSTKKFRDELRHTLWLMPSRDAAKAMKELMEKHPVFGHEYRIINVVDQDDDMNNTDSDLLRVRKAIGPHPARTRTITLTVRKLTTGVNVPEWTAVFFLSNTNSAMQYLQAAFRAQTAYSDEEFGMKTDCYIFDFAPDRALTVMADAASLNTEAGKLATKDQKAKMGELLNFLPIIGEIGQGMKPYRVDSLLTRLKRVYAEKAVSSGFDDDSLYNDKFLLMSNVDVSAFNDLKAIVGTTKAQKKKISIDINSQGLTDEQYDEALFAEKKLPKERTEEEKTLLKRTKLLKKQRKTMISILRSISIRIPMMIYGMKIDIDRDVDIDTFIRLVDLESWEEFMPKGVTKEKFREFAKYYDPEIFIEAGRIIRRRVHRLDKMQPLDRAAALATIFGTFKNPDKETVLTPWRVVNMQLGMTIGGYSYFDKQYDQEFDNTKSVRRWIETNQTEKTFSSRTRMLDINAKTGLYPLYLATSLFYLAQKELNEGTAGKFSSFDEDNLWQRILRNNIFVVAKTPMAQTITQRTLAGFKDYSTNVAYIGNVVSEAKANVESGVDHVKEAFGNMKFDVVVGNPPYQEEERGGSLSKKPIYNLFMDMAYQLADKAVLITPARFLFNAGDTPKTWNEKMLHDKHLKVVYYERDSNKVFPRTDIKGGIAITMHDTTQNFGEIGVFTPYAVLNNIVRKVRLVTKDSLSDIGFSRTSYKLTEKMHIDFPEAADHLSEGHKYDVASNIFDNLPNIFIKDKPNNHHSFIRILGRSNGKRVYRWVRREYINDHPNLDKYKVLIASAVGSGQLGEALSTVIVAGPGIGHTETFISIGSFDSSFEANAALKYVKTKFARIMLGVLKVTQNGPISVWRMVPLQDFTQHSDIDWSKKISDIDRQLFSKYGLNSKERAFVESTAVGMV